MPKTITANQLLGEQGEAAVRLRFLDMGFQFDQRSRLESGIDGIAEVMDKGQPLARMIAVQIKTTESGKYASETESTFSYLLKSEDLEYWRPANLPIIIVLHRRSDNTFFWKEVLGGVGEGERRLQFDKVQDVLDRNAVDRLAALTVPKAGFGYYVPPLGEGEDAIVNMLPITLPAEMFVASTAYDSKRAAAILLDGDEPARFDWAIKDGTFWSFHDPRTSVCRDIVDLDQVEAIETSHLAFHDDIHERNNFAFLLKQTLGHQTRSDLAWNKDRKIYYFKARVENESRIYSYDASKKRTEAEVVNVVRNKTDASRVEFVRHHAFEPRFENLLDQWFLVINPTYFFTTNGFTPHSYPAALLAGKKRMDKSASLRGQVIMWHRFLTESDRAVHDLFAEVSADPRLIFGEPPIVPLSTRVPEDVWGPQKKVEEAEESDSLDLLRRSA
ncbi:DUF4365 domain-containing protein [Labrys sp. KNU-23]|uniref:DUF4365 domain-containing protein n=1 Tax=Labrys sp. KNU-23 TaxID=2789216 RepID=UPI0011EF82F3|nr:DUF4365 domain-containing protein [Labrys sp. KNU-23]QEN84744.1 DUF4365 domain-containing protein [Labrys sp. KNU-23]